MNIILIIAILGLVAVFLWALGHSGASRKGPSTAQSSKSFRTEQPTAQTLRSRQDELYNRLLSQVLGDRKKTDRLIEYERSRTPGLTDEKYIEMASSRIEKDNSR